MGCPSFRQHRRELRLVEHADELRDLAIESYREAEQRQEVWQLDASFHCADVGMRQAGAISESFLGQTGCVPELSQTRPEQLGHC